MMDYLFLLFCYFYFYNGLVLLLLCLFASLIVLCGDKVGGRNYYNSEGCIYEEINEL